jgi:hypothetical protein
MYYQLFFVAKSELSPCTDYQIIDDMIRKYPKIKDYVKNLDNRELTWFEFKHFQNYLNTELKNSIYDKHNN